MLSRQPKPKTTKRTNRTRSKSKSQQKKNNKLQNDPDSVQIYDVNTPLEDEFIDDINTAAFAIEERQEFIEDQYSKNISHIAQHLGTDVADLYQYMQTLILNENAFPNEQLFVLQAQREPWIPINSINLQPQTTTRKQLFCYISDLQTIGNRYLMTNAAIDTNKNTKPNNKRILGVVPGGGKISYKTVAPYYGTLPSTSYVQKELPPNYYPNRIAVLFGKQDELPIDIAYKQELFARSYEGIAAYHSFAPPQIQLSNTPLRMWDSYINPNLKTDMEFLNRFRVIPSPRYISDLKNRGLLDLYYIWKQTKTMPGYDLPHIMKLKVDTDREYKAALALYIMRTKFPIDGTPDRAQMHLAIENGQLQRLPIYKYVPKAIQDLFETYNIYFLSRVGLSERNNCPHMQLFSKLMKSREYDQIIKNYSRLRRYFHNAGLFNGLFRSKNITETQRIEIIETVSNETDHVSCNKCAQPILCIHRVCYYDALLYQSGYARPNDGSVGIDEAIEINETDNMKNKESTDINADAVDVAGTTDITADIAHETKKQSKLKRVKKRIHQNLGELIAENESVQLSMMRVFADSYFSTKTGYRFVCKKCAGVLFENYEVASKYQDRNIYSEYELKIIRNRINYVQTKIKFPKYVNRSKTFTGLDKIIYNVVYDNAQQYLNRGTVYYNGQLNKLTDMAIHAYVFLLKQTEPKTQFDSRILLSAEHNEHWIQKYKKLLRSHVFTAVDSVENDTSSKILWLPCEFVKRLKDVKPLETDESNNNTIKSNSKTAYGTVISAALKHLNKLYWFDPGNLTQETIDFAEQKRLSTIILSDTLPLETQQKLQPIIMNYFSDAKSFPFRTQLGHSSMRYTQQKHVTIAYLYGLNGQKHEWSHFIVKGIKEPVPLKELANIRKKYNIDKYQILDEYSPNTDAYLSKLGNIDAKQVKQTIIDNELAQNVQEYYLVDCPKPTQESISHDYNSNKSKICIRCGYPSDMNPDSMKKFVERFKGDYQKAVVAQQRLEEQSMLAESKSKPRKIDTFNGNIKGYEDVIIPESIDKQLFMDYGQNKTMGNGMNINKVLSFYNKIIIEAKAHIRETEIKERDYLLKMFVPPDLTSKFVIRVKGVILQLLQRLDNIEKNIASKLLISLQREIEIYRSTAKFFATGFSIYYNDFTDQDKLLGAKTNKEMERVDYGVAGTEPVFEDDVVDEDDNNLYQD